MKFRMAELMASFRPNQSAHIPHRHAPGITTGKLLIACWRPLHQLPPQAYRY
jgi:hypothetical protein